MLKILIAEDEEPIANLIKMNLRRAGYQCTWASDGEKAADYMDNEKFDLLLLDVMLPGINGYELMEYARALELPVIFLTANDLEQDILNGFDLGAEDYITKPFNMKILLRRVEVAIRRAGPSKTAEDGWGDGWLQLDFGALTAVRGTEKLSITPNEYKLLKILTASAGNIVTRQILLEKLWDSGGNFIDDHTLTVTLNRLRGKIEDKEHSYIRTVRGMGYIWTGRQN